MEQDVTMKTFDELWPGGPRFFCEGSFRLSTDSVLLADFAEIGRARRCMDLGCGAGVLMILLARRAPETFFEGVELQEDWAALCRENLAENGLADRSRVTAGDLRVRRCLPPAGSFDLVVANPPYFAENSGEPSPDPKRAAARDERSCTLSELCESAAYLCRWGGGFALVHRPERLSEVFCAMTAAGIQPKRLRLVHNTAASAPSLALIQGRRGGKPGLDIRPPLILCKPDGSESDELRRIYHREERT